MTKTKKQRVSDIQKSEEKKKLLVLTITIVSVGLLISYISA
jgi:hypothetical protein